MKQRTAAHHGPPTADDIEVELDRLRSLNSQEEGIIVVEGKRDVAALKRLGITKTVMQLDAPLFKIVERVAAQTKNVIILTDLDVEGRKLYHELATQFQRMHVKINDSLRSLLFHTQLRHIEGLDTFVEHLRTKEEKESA